MLSGLVREWGVVVLTKILSIQLNKGDYLPLDEIYGNDLYDFMCALDDNNHLPVALSQLARFLEISADFVSDFAGSPTDRMYIQDLFSDSEISLDEPGNIEVKKFILSLYPELYTLYERLIV